MSRGGPLDHIPPSWAALRWIRAADAGRVPSCRIIATTAGADIRRTSRSDGIPTVLG